MNLSDCDFSGDKLSKIFSTKLLQFYHTEFLYNIKIIQSNLTGQTNKDTVSIQFTWIYDEFSSNMTD